MGGNRQIFEEVGTQSREQTTPQGGLIDRGQRGARRGIRLWLMMLFALVVVMIAVGGLTRLTDSGLSITEWRPVTGALPPMSEAEWQSEFEKYKSIPQFELQHSWMELDDFKSIYWWEWGHRQLGRVIGLVWALGFFGFLLARRVPPGWSGRLLLLGALGGAQGAIGWWMVSSGLGEGMIAVASYRLATHLGLAFVILGLIAWFAMLLARPERDLIQARRSRERKLFSLGTGWMHFAFLQILLGALVAGIDAGRSYTDWPWMAGGLLPPDMMELTPWWRNFFENPGTVQFIHRLVGYGLLIYGGMALLAARRSPNTATRRAFGLAFAALLAQVVLGIATVITIAPWQMAISHQVLGVITWVMILRARFAAAYPVASSIQRGTAA